MIVTRMIEKIKWLYDFQDPPILWLSNWYIRDAENIVHIERTADNIIKVSVPSPAKLRLEERLKEDMLKNIISPGQWGIFDVDEEDIVYSSDKGLVHKFWTYMPTLGKIEAQDFKTYLACDSSKGEFRMCYGSHRNLVLNLFAQCHTYGLTISGSTPNGPQTSFGRGLAIGLVLKRYGLPQRSQYSAMITKDLLYKKSGKELPDACFTELWTLDTSKKDEIVPVQPALIGTGSAIPPTTPIPTLELEFILNIGIEYEGQISFPYELNFDSFGKEVFPGATEMFLESSNSIVIKTEKYSNELVQNLEALMEGFKVTVHAPGISSIIDCRSDEDKEIDGEEDENETFT